MKSSNLDVLENRTFDEIRVGDSVSLQRQLTMRDIKLFAAVSGDVNPAHVDEDFARSSRFHAVIAHGMWGGSQISTLLGTQLPGPGTIYLSQTLKFHNPVRLGDTMTARVTVAKKDEKKKVVTFDCECFNQTNELLISGQATVLAPTEKITRPRWIIPDVRVNEMQHLHRLLEAAKQGPPVTTAVVHPVDAESLRGVVAAAEAGLINPVLVGPEHKIRTAAQEAQLDLSDYRIVSTPHSHAAARKAVQMARGKEVQALKKGSLHTDEFMQPVVARDGGLRTHRRMSHIFAFDVPTYTQPLFITDAALNITPDVVQKRDIIQNAIDLAHLLAIDTPRVAVLSAIETVNPKIQSSVDAAILAQMAQRGEITGGEVDGPLAFDNAISPEAARIKGIQSPVAGQANILVVPDLEAGNMLAKQLEYLAGAEGAGIVVGAQVPIALTSRADDTISRLAACALVKLLANRKL